jgi:hypothetical protein
MKEESEGRSKRREENSFFFSSLAYLSSPSSLRSSPPLVIQQQQKEQDFQVLQRVTSFRERDLEKLCSHFKTLHVSNLGSIDFESFQELLGLMEIRDPILLSQLFKQFDDNGGMTSSFLPCCCCCCCSPSRVVLAILLLVSLTLSATLLVVVVLALVLLFSLLIDRWYYRLSRVYLWVEPSCYRYFRRETPHGLQNF